MFHASIFNAPLAWRVAYLSQSYNFLKLQLEPDADYRHFYDLGRVQDQNPFKGNLPLGIKYKK